MPSFEGNLLIQRHEVCSQETRDSRMSYVKNPDRRTDRIMIANTRLALRAVARKNQPNQLIREHYPQFTAYNLQHAIDK